jgi:ribose transport system ATP-binding protein
MQCIFGLTKEYSGEIQVNGKSVHFTSARQAIKKGIALVPEDRKLDGLFLIQSVTYNSTIEILEKFIRGIHKDQKKEQEIAEKYNTLMKTKTASLMQCVGTLSGGNQQKVLIGRWLATKPKILILDEPTRGIDVGAKSEIYAIINELAKQGISIIMISSELPEIINMSDRVYVMANGRMTGCIDHDSLSQEKIMQLATV